MYTDYLLNRLLKMDQFRVDITLLVGSLSCFISVWFVAIINYKSKKESTFHKSS